MLRGSSRQELGVKLRSGHIHLDKDRQKSIDEAAEAGQECLVSAALPSPGQTIENYQRSADDFSRYAENCKKSNLLFGHRNHDNEFQQVNGKVLYEILLERADPGLVHMEMDLGWVVAAGQDPLAYFAKYPERFPLWHLKDMDRIAKRSTEFGLGQVNILGLMQHAGQSGMKYFFVEQEEYSHSDWESMQKDYYYLSRLHY
jgi:sugar phosphate isomerase/epimerase